MERDEVLRGVGPRLRQLRLERQATLGDLADETGIAVSTLSRLESGQRKPTLELLLPLARAHQVARPCHLENAGLAPHGPLIARPV